MLVLSSEIVQCVLMCIDVLPYIYGRGQRSTNVTLALVCVCILSSHFSPPSPPPHHTHTHTPAPPLLPTLPLPPPTLQHAGRCPNLHWPWSHGHLPGCSVSTQPPQHPHLYYLPRSLLSCCVQTGLCGGLTHCAHGGVWFPFPDVILTRFCRDNDSILTHFYGDWDSILTHFYGDGDSILTSFYRDDGSILTCFYGDGDSISIEMYLWSYSRLSQTVHVVWYD